MNRNSSERFQIAPSVNVQRSKFQRNSQHKTTMETGDLVPIYIDEVLPGDTFTINQASIVRMATPIAPVMDNAYLDIYYFYVPNRIIWNHWKEFMGENTSGYWTQTTEYEIPQLITDVEDGVAQHSIADYMGIPSVSGGLSVNHLPFRAYCLIWNEWFRDQNLQSPANINFGDASVTGVADITGDYVTDAQLGGACLRVNKYHDYFTSCLPEPQKGEEVLLPLGELAPVTARNTHHNLATTTMDWRKVGGADFVEGQYKQTGMVGTDANTGYSVASSGTIGSNPTYAAPANLWADLSLATASTINNLRQAFAIQRLLERDARSGTRYTEIIRAHFGTTSPDARQQRPEYLGGSRTPINMDQVLQTSSTDQTSPQGNTAAYSLTGRQENVCTKSFTEHGYIIGLAAIRTDHTYQNGLERMWSRKDRFDFYFPALANIGEQAVLKKEIYTVATDDPEENTNEEVFGYQEAWAEYRYKPNRTSASMRSQAEGSLDIWHYGDNFEAPPNLSDVFIAEPAENVARTLAVQATKDQFIADFYFQVISTRPMPIYSIPGLIDHH